MRRRETAPARPFAADNSIDFMDYAMPRAGDLPNFVFSTHNVQSTSNPFGVKGAGESGRRRRAARGHQRHR